ncbi:hypothetical protein A6A06_38065 [Streptomyces sp. CB02923]|uniref:hypothetical protein n=1 Tax=Streptomyces sp. CB02923 TaxID=1718985 RepID=UPI00093B74EF|nr:hypothetical protein [Streptomyces sp. CB02923]OKI06169.1 hypothetical protein A6A06_38065 [Streptomyces sp. CB02923]
MKNLGEPRMRKRARWCALGAATMIAWTSFGASATAAPNRDNVELACGGSKYKFTFHWSSSLNGSWRHLGYSEWNLGSVPQAGTINASGPLTFCPRKGRGSGQSIMNNSTAAENGHSKYRGWVYYNSGYKGAVDKVPTFSSMRLKKTFNNNASFQWKS